MALTTKIDSLKAARAQFELEFQERLKEMQEQEEQLLKAAESGDKLVAAVKKINLDPVMAYEILLEAGLIVAPVAPASTDKAGVAPIYRHPKDHSLTSTGRGKRAKWIVEYLNGDETKLKDLLITNQEAPAPTE